MPRTKKTAPQVETTTTVETPATVAPAEGFTQALALLQAHPAAAKRDIAVCFKQGSKHNFDEKTYSAGVALGVDWSVVFALPQKQVKRATQLVNALSAGVVGMLDATHTRALIAMRLAGSHKLTTDAVIALAAGVYRADVETRGVGRSAINALFSRSHGLSTVQTKVSNSLGARGMYQALGVTYGEPGKQNREFALNESHPLVVRFFDVINGATVGQLSQLSGEGDAE